MTTTFTSTRDALVDEAAQANAQYPQYAGHWDLWQVAYAKVDVKHRGRLVLRKGAAVLYDPTSVHIASEPDYLPRAVGKAFMTVYLPCNKVDTVVRADKFTSFGVTVTA